MSIQSLARMYLEFWKLGISAPVCSLKTYFRNQLWPATTKSRQSCLTLCDPRDGSPPGSPVPGILQARTLEWVAISFPSA